MHVHEGEKDKKCRAYLELGGEPDGAVGAVAHVHGGDAHVVTHRQEADRGRQAQRTRSELDAAGESRDREQSGGLEIRGGMAMKMEGEAAHLSSRAS